MLAYFAQLPLAVIGLALGLMPAAVAAAFAAILVALFSPRVGALGLFIITSALPILMVVYFALQNQIDDKGNTAWYPVGRILVWLSMLGIGPLSLPKSFSCRATEAYAVRSRRISNRSLQDLRRPIRPPWMRCSRPLQRFSPVLPPSWILMNIINCAMAQQFPTAADKNIRPKPVYSDIEIPSWPAGIVVLGGVLAFLAENRAFSASTLC